MFIQYVVKDDIKMRLKSLYIIVSWELCNIYLEKSNFNLNNYKQLLKNITFCKSLQSLKLWVNIFSYLT